MVDAMIYNTSDMAANATNATLFELASETPPKYFSPIMLMENIPQVSRLVFMIVASVFGTIINGFFVAAFFIEDSLSIPGNIYLTCTGSADFLITAFVMSTSAATLMSGKWDNPKVCSVLQIIGETACYAYSIFFVFVAIENYLRACGNRAHHQMFLKLTAIYMPVILYVLCSGLSTYGVLLKYDSDYCERQYISNLNFRASTMILFHVIPALIVINLLCAALRKIEIFGETHSKYKRSFVYRHQRRIFRLNLTVFMVYVTSWIPHIIVIIGKNDDDEHYYYTVWLGLFRSLYSSLIYPACDRDFRRAFKHLFKYCFCKITLAGAYIRRHHRTARRRDAGIEMTVQDGQRERPISLESRPPTIESHSL